MREIIFNMSLITLLFGCNQSQNYLENHKVFPCSPEIVQEKNIELALKKQMTYMSNIYMIEKKLRT